jgi:hypothetical protein
MSGGSFNYLCGASDYEDLMEKYWTLLGMADYLERGWPDHPATVRTREIATEIGQLRERRLTQELLNVWKAVEWKVSGDWGADQVQEAFDTYGAMQ